MSQALVTIIAPLAPERVKAAEVDIDRLGNPADAAVGSALDAAGGIHFASLHALASTDGLRAHLVLEFSADGEAGPAIERVARALGPPLAAIFAHARDHRPGGDLVAYLRAHQVAVGGGLFANAGIVFAGTPGMSVARIQNEARLAGRITTLLGEQPAGLGALDRLRDIRTRLAADPEHRGALDPATPEPPFRPIASSALIAALIGPFAATYLWPLGVLLIVGVVAWTVAGSPYPDLWAGAGRALEALWRGLWIGLVVLLAFAVIVYTRLRAAEATDWLDDRAPARATNAAMFARENRGAQNHMVSVTQRKPGWVRWLTQRLAFWVVANTVARRYRPGFLADIGTIHFARWVTPPGSPDLLFFSNYGGSWESYLEDFITRAHSGLTAIWSNSIGFPRTANLAQGGASDGERFKRFARASMVPTRFWYSAYPTLTTARVRTNAAIRRGLSGAMTEDEAVAWLALFGSAVRPALKLVSSNIQSLAFGGLGFLRFGACALVDLPDDARGWLRLVAPKVAFNDGRRHRHDAAAVVTLALSPRGLERLGLPAHSLDTFPQAFLDGMTEAARARLLGDVRDDARPWLWGERTPDAALLVYGHSDAAVDERLAEVTAGCRSVHLVRLKPLPEREEPAADETGARPAWPTDFKHHDKTEPFGFVDGVSQPVMRGTYKGLRHADPIHLVEPGEFILGYPDNRRSLPPGPTMPALDDPENLLPLVATPAGFDHTVVETARDVGRDGSFLVIRELEQDVPGFHDYCAREAERLADRLPPPYQITSEFIGAKLVGRWQDGSSLVRNPYESETDAKKKLVVKPTARTEASAAQSDDIGPPPQPLPDALGDNDFLFGVEDPEGLRCPFGSHVRRSNPRESFDPGSADQVAITNRHRILRVGRFYDRPDAKPGLFFMCLNGDIERQFEFIQQTWLNSPSFHGLSCEKDPIMGDGEPGACGYTIPSRDGPVVLAPLARYVATRGGGYFFMPGKRLIDWLATRP